MLGDVIREWRVRRGLSQARLAKAAGVSRQTVLSCEQGRRHPRIDVLQKIAAALDVDPAELMQAEATRQTSGQSCDCVRLPIVTLEQLGTGYIPDDAPQVECLRSLVSHPKLVVLKVETRDNWPSILPDDLLIVDPTADRARSGDLVVIRNGATTLRHMVRGRRGTIWLAENPTVPPFENVSVEILGVATYLLHRRLR